ncbi:MAG: gamma-glutamyltransferase, partial [Rhodospirillales bacterium]|nr:gamma-glutamyltransferase [Rhodospirillales bacterium]
MRDFQRPGRSTVHGTRGVAATSHPLATATAIEVLRTGGNAVDAAVAACAVQGVVEPQSTGIGGDCFALYAPGGRVPPYAINGSGPAPAAASVDWFREQGIDAIGFESPHAVTVPGAVGAWERLLADHGTKGLDEVLQPAIRYAEEGFVVHSRVAHDWANAAEKLRACENARAFYLPGGRAPRAGDIHRLPALAATLRLIAKDGARAFYQGAIADDIASHLAAHGSLMTADDLAAFQPQAVEPISTSYRGYDIYECPPNGQGIIALIILNILEGFELAGLDPVGAERLHLEAEACRLGYRDRAALIADPDAVEVPVAGLLSADYAAAMRRHISRDRAMPAELPPGYPAHGDTIYLTVVDGEGNAISFINSLFASFGTGLCTASGVMLQNRGASFV